MKKYYAVAIGKKSGVYLTWNDAKVQVDGFAGAKYKSFPSFDEAKNWIEEINSGKNISAIKKVSNNQHKKLDDEYIPKKTDTIIYTDGGCINNPGSGGYGAVIIKNGKQRVLSGGFKRTTNNRMELFALVAALKDEDSTDLIIYSDSKYLVNGISLGWAKKWRANNWKKSDGNKAENTDLWDMLLNLLENRNAKFIWVKGHASNPLNEICDVLANTAARSNNTKEDFGYA